MLDAKSVESGARFMKAVLNNPLEKYEYRDGRVTVENCPQGPSTNNHILTQNLYYNYYYPNPKYLVIGYMNPLGCIYTGTTVTSSRYMRHSRHHPGGELQRSHFFIVMLRLNIPSAQNHHSLCSIRGIVPRPSSYPLSGPKYPLLGTICPQLRVLGRSW